MKLKPIIKHDSSMFIRGLILTSCNAALTAFAERHGVSYDADDQSRMLFAIEYPFESARIEAIDRKIGGFK